MRQIAYMLIGMLAGFILAGAVFIVSTRVPAGKPITLEPAPTKTPIVVQVQGGVVRPGVYKLPEGSRVQDAVDAAGGLLADVDTGSLNMAAKVEDGQQIEIPGGTGGAGAAGTTSSSGGGSQPGTGVQPFTVIPTVSSGPPSGPMVNINTAGLDELETLPNVGATLAQRIIDYRDQHGDFTHIEDIMNVPGFGLATFDSIKDMITVGP